MGHLTLVITDFALPGDSDVALPRLPALESLIARGGSAPAGDPGWRHWTLAQAGLPVQGDLPVAAVIAGRVGHWAVATPVHLLAGLKQVHFDTAGLPCLAAAQQTALASSFNETFGGDGLALSFADGTGLLELPRPLEAVTHDPLPLAGREAGAWLPAGPDGGRLRRLMTEIQMWLCTQPLNEQRLARQEPVVNALWIWGLGRAELPAPAATLPTLASADTFLRAAWRRADGEVIAPPDSFADCTGEREHVLATFELSSLSDSPAEALEAAEVGWFAPLVEALARGRSSGVRVWLAGHVLELEPRDRLRFWRRRRAWHEALR